MCRLFFLWNGPIGDSSEVPFVFRDFHCFMRGGFHSSYHIFLVLLGCAFRQPSHLLTKDGLKPKSSPSSLRRYMQKKVHKRGVFLLDEMHYRQLLGMYLEL